MRLIKSVTIIFLVLLVDISNAQGVTSMMAYDTATQYRNIADRLWNSENPSPEHLKQALLILDNGLNYLDQAYVWDLAAGNKYLKYRRVNILNDIAHIYSLLRQKDSTIKTLKAISDVGGYYYSSMESDTAFDFIRTENEYKQLIVNIKLSESMWKGNAFQTLYSDNLPIAEKIAGLSLLWSQAKYNFVHFDHAGIDWNQQYLNYIDLVTKTNSTADYYKILIRFYASLRDGHTNVYFPTELTDKFYSRPPFRTELIENRIFVTELFSDTLLKMGIENGLEILSINGEPVFDYAAKNVEPYQSSSTHQDMQIRKFTYGLLSGSKDELLQIKFRNKQGKEWLKLIPRKGYSNITSLPSITYSQIEGIGYLQLNSFNDNGVIKLYDSLFKIIADTKGLIIDLRKNGGGSSDIGFHILSTLTDKRYAISTSKITQYNSANGDDAQWYSFFPQKLYPSKKMQYSKPVIVLISARTFSAAEDFVVAFSYMHRGKLIGQTTGGSTGAPILFNLPGGGTARVCSKDDSFPDGKIFVGVGIIPDIFINKTISDLYNNNDAALMKALELLK